MSEENSDTILIFKIILPFWIDIPNNSIFEKQYNNRSYTIEIKQDFWLVNFRSNFQNVALLVQEEGVISREFKKPRIIFDDINPLDLSQEKQFGEDWHYMANKAKTILIFNLNIPYLENDDYILNYIKTENIWSDVKDLINYFLSIYTFIRINSNMRECPIFPLSNDYYTSENTMITYKAKQELNENYLGKMNMYLKIPYFYNYHTLISDNQSLEFFKERVSRRNDLKLKLDERMKISIEFARRLRDINSMIINTCIYLERISIEYLSFKKDLDKSELDILYKQKGLTHYVECQLPHFLENSVDSKIVKDSIDLVRLRNEIIHFGSNFSYNKDLEEKCNNTLKLIYLLETEIKPDKEKIKFNFKGKPLGRAIEISPEEVLLLRFESELEANYNLRNELLLNKISEVHLRKFIKIPDDFQNFQLSDDFMAYCRIFFRDKNYLMIFSLNPTQNNLNFDFFEKIISYIKLNLKIEALKICFISQHIPTGTLNLFKKVIETKLKDFKQELNINLEFNYYVYLRFKDPRQQEIFYKIIELYNSKKEEIISEDEIYKNFEKKEIDNLFNYYPDFFQKKIVNEKIFWVLHGKMKNIESIK